MILYNVTVTVDNDISEDWFNWMVDIHIPDVMKTGFFSEYKVCRLLEPADSNQTAYCIQYTSPSFEAFETYQQEHAPGLQKEHRERYQGRVKASRTLMKIVEEGGRPNRRGVFKHPRT